VQAATHFSLTFCPLSPPQPQFLFHLKHIKFIHLRGQKSPNPQPNLQCSTWAAIDIGCGLRAWCEPWSRRQRQGSPSCFAWTGRVIALGRAPLAPPGAVGMMDGQTDAESLCSQASVGERAAGCCFKGAPFHLRRAIQSMFYFGRLLNRFHQGDLPHCFITW